MPAPPAKRARDQRVHHAVTHQHDRPMLARELDKALGGAVRTGSRLAQRLGPERPTAEPRHARQKGPVARGKSQARVDARRNSGLGKKGLADETATRGKEGGRFAGAPQRACCDATHRRRLSPKAWRRRDGDVDRSFVVAADPRSEGRSSNGTPVIESWLAVPDKKDLKHHKERASRGLTDRG